MAVLKSNDETFFWCSFCLHVFQEFQKSALPTLFHFVRIRAPSSHMLSKRTLWYWLYNKKAQPTLKVFSPFESKGIEVFCFLKRSATSAEMQVYEQPVVHSQVWQPPKIVALQATRFYSTSLERCNLSLHSLILRVNYWTRNFCTKSWKV